MPQNQFQLNNLVNQTLATTAVSGAYLALNLDSMLFQPGDSMIVETLKYGVMTATIGEAARMLRIWFPFINILKA